MQFTLGSKSLHGMIFNSQFQKIKYYSNEILGNYSSE